jgi:hypothetical protein
MWNMKSTLFPLVGLDGDKLESCCNMLGIEHIVHSSHLITGRGCNHLDLMVTHLPEHSGYGMVTNNRSNHLDL